MPNSIHICCSNQPQEDGYQKISSSLDFKDLDLANTTYVLLNIHLDWDSNLLSNDYGFEIARIIRLEFKYLGPILFYSPMLYEEFVSKAQSDYKYKILFGRGSEFISLPTTQNIVGKAADAITPLTNTVLRDVSTMLCDLKGVVVDKIRHDLKKPSDAEKVILEACRYLNNNQILDVKAKYYMTEFKEKTSEFRNIKEEFLNRCERYLALEKVSSTKKDLVKHTILVIDDEKEVLKEIERNLGIRFNIICFQNGEDAIDALSKDEQNYIVAVIADWRLYDVKHPEKWQAVQGYEILSYAAKNKFRALFALTSQAEFIVHLIRNEMAIDFTLFKKSDLIDSSGWSVVSDVIQEKCNSVVKTLSNLPSAKGWTRKRGNTSFRELYFVKRNSINRVIFFDDISKTSSEIWEYINEIYKKGNNFKDILIIPEKEGLSLSNSKPDVKPALILRRLWYALWKFHPQKDSLSNSELLDEVHRIIYRSGIKNPNIDIKTLQSQKSQDPSKVGITLRDLSQGRMFPEEKQWLNTIKQLG